MKIQSIFILSCSRLAPESAEIPEMNTKNAPVTLQCTLKRFGATAGDWVLYVIQNALCEKIFIFWLPHLWKKGPSLVNLGSKLAHIAVLFWLHKRHPIGF